MDTSSEVALKEVFFTPLPASAPNIYSSRLLRFEENETFLFVMVDSMGFLSWAEFDSLGRIEMRRLRLSNLIDFSLRVNGVYSVNHLSRTHLLVASTSRDKASYHVFNYLCEYCDVELSLVPVQVCVCVVCV